MFAIIPFKFYIMLPTLSQESIGSTNNFIVQNKAFRPKPFGIILFDKTLTF